jgi:hypothetical protein
MYNFMRTIGLFSCFEQTLVQWRREAGAEAPAEKGRAPKSQNSGAATEKGAPIKFLVPQLCSGNRQILALPLPLCKPYSTNGLIDFGGYVCMHFVSSRTQLPLAYWFSFDLCLSVTLTKCPHKLPCIISSMRTI